MIRSSRAAPSEAAFDCSRLRTDPGLCEEFGKRARQGLPAARAETLDRDTVLIVDLAVDIGGEGRRGVMRDETGDLFGIARTPDPLPMRREPGDDGQHEETSRDREQEHHRHAIAHEETDDPGHTGKCQQIDGARRKQGRRAAQRLELVGMGHVFGPLQNQRLHSGAKALNPD